MARAIDVYGEIVPLQVDLQRRCRVAVGDRGINVGNPWPAGDGLTARRDRRLVLREDIAAVRFAYVVAAVLRIGGGVRDRRGETILCLVVVDGGCGGVHAAMIGTKCDVAKPARHLRARCSQTFKHLDRAAEIVAVHAVHIVELLCECLHDIGDVCRSDPRMLGNHCGMTVRLCLFDLDIAALERSRRGCVMFEEEVCMPRIVRDGEILCFLHVDIARARSSCTARELREAACDKTRCRAVVLVVPRTAILQVEIHPALVASVDCARELGVRRREGETRQRVFSLFGIFAVCQDVALNIDLTRAEIPVFVHIDKDARTLARIADGAMLGIAAPILTNRQPVELCCSAPCCFNASDIIACAALDVNVRITDHAHEVVAVVIDAVGLANAIDIHIERFRRNGHRSVAAARRTMSTVIDTCKEAIVCLFRLDGQRLIRRIDRQWGVAAENCAVEAVRFDRRILRKGVDARRIFHLGRDVLRDASRCNLACKFGLLLLIRRLGRGGVFVVCTLSRRVVVTDRARPLCGRGNKPFVDLDGA